MEPSVRLSVVVPAYNEEERLESTLARVTEYLEGRFPAWEVVVVSDGSTDRTAAIAEQIARGDDRIRCLAYETNRGKGYALRRGVEAAKFEWILLSDADLATPIEEVEKLFAADRPIAIGSRALWGSRLEVRQPWWRETLGRGFNLAVQLLAVPGVWDTQCGFKLLRGDVAREVFSDSTLDGYGYDFEILMIARRRGHPIAEVPVRWFHREGSKVSVWGDGMEMLADLIRLRLRRPTRRSAGGTRRPVP